MSRPLLPDGLAEVWEQVRDAGRLSLFLDFDGTVTPIVANAGDAQLEPGMKAVLESLAGRDDTLLAFISGRAVDDLQQRVGIPNVVYAGNHGLEISGRGLNFVEPSALAKRELLKRLVDGLNGSLRHIRGAWVEDKALTASVHYRQAAAREERAVANIVHAALAHCSAVFQLNAGKKVFEIVPRTKWHKGAAVCWINARLAGPGAASIYIGDDRTDEDAFVQLPGEITIRVGDAEQDTAARYHVGDPGQVGVFLAWLNGKR
ncbi:MAG TPA: trehalose-phosphatase [Candidatus Acidoferrales bacterium]|jgi:trehalose 6-phosphate phosphatase|nr:trehalose-phosphatase [Candidatus Acidoferrales bacterium]